jgi:Uma2 family endonuclease
MNVVALPTQSPPFPIARFTVEKYHRMIEAGAFTEDDRVELIEGWVVKQMAKGPSHAYSTRQVDPLLSALVPQGWHVRNQEPVTLTTSEPEPDIAIVRGPATHYRDRHPFAEDLVLVVEVSDTSLETDRLKGKTYGRAGIPQYWIVNLVDRCVEIYTQPSGPAEHGYAARAVIHAGDIEVVADGRSLGRIPIASVLP